MLNKNKLIVCVFSVSILSSLSSISLSEDVLGEQSKYVTNQPDPNTPISISENISKNLDDCATIVKSKVAKEIKQIELSYETDNPSTVIFCYWGNHLVTSIESEQDNQLTVKIPKKLVYSISDTDCEEGDLITLVDEEVAFPLDIIREKKENVIVIEFSKGRHIIEFIGVSITPDPLPSDYCGIVMGFDSQFLPPKFQIERGMKAEQIRCNEGLELTLKSNNGEPICVKPETKQKLVERGWAKPV